MDYEATKRVLAALEGVRYVIVGAAALNLHGLARFTEDLDLFVAPDHGNIRRLRARFDRCSTIRTSTRSRRTS